MNQRTPLYDAHLAAEARIVDFAGWDMPIHYGSQLDEHHQVRNDAGMFDVSHMTVVDLRGVAVRAFLRHLLANDVAKLKTPGCALYSCMLNQQGGVIDDLISYFLTKDWFRLIVNAATRDKDLHWITQQARAFNVAVTPRDDTAMIAVQGPRARDKAIAALHGFVAEPDRTAVQSLKRFSAHDCAGWFVARTGYTGEDGFEIVLPAASAMDFWDALLASGVAPAGLGARDTLRLEAGLNLYDQDMTEQTTPLESNLGWTVAWTPAERDFIGATALRRQREIGNHPRLLGLELLGRGVLRHGYRVFSAAGEGTITSGSFAPTLQRSIAMVRFPATTEGQCEVEIRNRRVAAKIVPIPFLKR